jgi:hypothetical protein
MENIAYFMMIIFRSMKSSFELRFNSWFESMNAVCNKTWVRHRHSILQIHSKIEVLNQLFKVALEAQKWLGPTG